MAVLWWQYVAAAAAAHTHRRQLIIGAFTAISSVCPVGNAGQGRKSSRKQAKATA